MKKYLIYNLAALGLIVGTFVACEYSQDAEPVVSPNGYPNVTVTPVEAYSVVKEGDTIFFNVTSDKMLDRALTFDINVVGGDADDHDYISVPGVIAPFTTSSQLMVIFPIDADAEPTESISFEVGIFSTGERYLVQPGTEYPTVDLTIENYVSGILYATVGWSQAISGIEVIYGETELPNGDVVEWVDTVAAEYDAATYMDIDILISPAATFDIADPWASEIGNYSGATGNNPEVVEAELEDGEYILWTDLWYNELYDPEAHEFLSYDDSTLTVSMSANFIREGTTMDINIDLAEPNIPYVYQPGALWSYSPSVYTGFAFNGVIAKIVVAEGVISIVNYDDDSVYGSARKSAKTRTPRPDFLHK